MTNNDEKKYFVWVETEKPAGGIQNPGKFEKVSPPLSQDTAKVIRKLYEMEYPDKLFSVSLAAPKSFRF